MKRQDWNGQWQVDTPEQGEKETPCKNEALQDLEEALPPMGTEDLKRAASSYKTSTGVGADGIHPKVLLDFCEGTRGKFVVFLAKVEQCVQWPAQASTLPFLHFPKHVTSERPIALLPTLLRWWEWLRAPVVQEWEKKRRRVKWDATEGRNGGAARTAWEALLEMERYTRSIFEKVQVVWACAIHLGFPKQKLGHQRRSFSRGVWQTRCRPSQQFFLDRSGVVCFVVLCFRMR